MKSMKISLSKPFRRTLIVLTVLLALGTMNLGTMQSITAVRGAKATTDFRLLEQTEILAQLDATLTEMSPGSAFVEQSPLVAADGAQDDQFGSAVALAGDTLIVGAGGVAVGDNPSQGAAYVFVRSNTTWSLQQRLVANDGADGDGFGFRVALAGDTAVVGAYFATVDGKPQQGAAYVFVRTGTTWSQQQKLVANDGAKGDQFGQSLALAGETVVVGAATSSIQGAAYVFVRSGTTWHQQQKLVANDGAVNDQFGHTVALVGDTTLIGAPVANGTTGWQGAAYVFMRSDTTWQQQQKLVAADAANNDLFGISVALTGDTAVIGASGAAVGSNPVQGAAYVFVRSGPTWSQQQKLISADGAEGDQFGWSVALAKDTAVISGIGIAAGRWHGPAYLFLQSNNTWRQQQQLVAAAGADHDLFGNAVALSDDLALFGAGGARVGDNVEQGRVFIFERQLLGNPVYLPLIAR